MSEKTMQICRKISLIFSKFSQFLMIFRSFLPWIIVPTKVNVIFRKIVCYFWKYIEKIDDHFLPWRIVPTKVNLIFRKIVCVFRKYIEKIDDHFSKISSISPILTGLENLMCFYRFLGKFQNFKNNHGYFTISKTQVR